MLENQDGKMRPVWTLLTIGSLSPFYRTDYLKFLLTMFAKFQNHRNISCDQSASNIKNLNYENNNGLLLIIKVPNLVKSNNLSLGDYFINRH